MYCKCCNAMLDNTGGTCDTCRYTWDVKSPAEKLCMKPDRPSEYVVGHDEKGRECVVAKHHFIDFSITHFLYWANAPLRLREQTKQLIQKSNLPYEEYPEHWLAAEELTGLTQKFHGAFPDYVVLERNSEGGVTIVQVVSRHFKVVHAMD